MKKYAKFYLSLLLISVFTCISSERMDYYDLDNPSLSVNEECPENNLDDNYYLQYLSSQDDPITPAPQPNTCPETNCKPTSPCKANGYSALPACQQKKKCNPCAKPRPCPSKPCKPCELPPPVPCQPCRPCQPCQPCKPCCTEIPKTQVPCNCAYNAPARIDPACGWDMWICSSFLYLQPKEQGINLGATIQAESDHSSRTSYKQIKDLDPSYHPAFQVAIGCSGDCDDWCFVFKYTRFYSTDKSSLEIAHGGLQTHRIDSPWINKYLFIDPLFSSNAFVNQVNLKWKLQTNLFDLSLSRPYYLGKKVIVSPSFGLIGGIIDQYIMFTALISNSNNLAQSCSFKNKTTSGSWLIGPRAEIGSKWSIGCGFNLFADIALSLFYQDFITKIKASLPIQPNNAIDDESKTKSKQFYLTPNIEFNLGLNVGGYLLNNSLHLELSSGYQLQYFWNQNLSRQLNDRTNTVSNLDKFYNIGNLMLHGLIITLKIDF